MKTLTLSISRKFALAAGLIAGLAGAAHAESFSVTVPFAFTASGKNLPAGSYTVEPIASGFIMLRGATSADTAAVAATPAGFAETYANPCLNFASGEVAALSSIRMDNGALFTVAPVKHLTAAPSARAPAAAVLTHP